MPTRVAHASRFPLVAHATATAHAGRSVLAGGPVAHVGQTREHGAQAVKQSQQGQDLCFGGEVEDQYAFKGGGCFARLAARAAKAAQPVGALTAGGFRDAKVGAQKRAAELVL